MKDKDFELKILDLSEGSLKTQEELNHIKTFDKDDLHSAFIAGFDFEESFEDWYKKFIKNGDLDLN